MYNQVNGDDLEGYTNQDIRRIEVQGQPPYYPPQQPSYQQPPYPQPGYGPPPIPAQPPAPLQTSKPLVAGILLIIFGIINIGNAIYTIITVETALTEIPGIGEGELEFVKDFVYICSGIGIVLSIIAILGGYFATQRIKWPIAMIGAILALFTIGPVCLTSLTALIAIILLFMSKDEFNGARPSQTPGPPPTQPGGY
jgi:hypothetical protein